jgi:cytochrome c-type biogenesis protein CcmF
VLSSWFFLTLGILLGSIWAYYELGWGGFWFWDPVENVSLMPMVSINNTFALCFGFRKKINLNFLGNNFVNINICS